MDQNLYAELSKPFKAGFLCGLRHARGLRAIPALDLLYLVHEGDFNAGYAAGWRIALDSNDLLIAAQTAWTHYLDTSYR